MDAKRFQVVSDYRKFDRRFAVVDTARAGQPWQIQTNDEARAIALAAELNAEVA